jgi:D-aminopeptidase
MRNLLPDRLHPSAHLAHGKTKPMGMLEGLAWTPVLPPLCASGSTPKPEPRGSSATAFMGHEIGDMWLGNQPLGESRLVQATAAALGAPGVMIFGGVGVHSSIVYLLTE